MQGRARVYIASSLDGFIAGPSEELDWLGDPTPDPQLPEGVLGFEAFMKEVGAMVMGRRTYDVVAAMEGPWFYGDTPILVPTHRPLDARRPSVRATSGPIEQILDEALRIAGGRDVYVDGGATIREALAADRIDEIVLTVVPVLLGQGIPLFAGLSRRVPLEVRSHRDYGRGMVQLVLSPARSL